MSDIVISYARSTAARSQQVAEALRALGYSVWRDDELPAHRAYADVIEERLKAAKAVVVSWSAEAVKSQWVRSEAERAREDDKLVQLTVDGSRLPMPFGQIQCADLAGWTGDTDAPGWRKVVGSIAELVSGVAPSSPSVANAPVQLPSKPSIAVLPFANLSGDPEQDYFADGRVVEITGALSRSSAIIVIASNSALTFRGRSAQDAGTQLGVRYVLEGSVRKAGKRVRISVQLVAAEDGTQIWTERFEDSLDDVFALQDLVAASVAAAIGSKLEAAEIRRAAEHPTQDLGAYDLYLRALPLSRDWERASLEQALKLLEVAIEKDPNYSSALVYAGFTQGLLWYAGWADDREGSRACAIEFIRRALRVARDDPDVLGYAASSLMNLGDDIVEAMRLCDRSLAINPASAIALVTSGWLNAVYGSPETALSHLETLLRLDPQSPIWMWQLTPLGMALFALRRFDDAIIPLTEVAKAMPAFSTPHVFLAACLAHTGRTAEANNILQRIKSVTSIDAAVAILREPVRHALLLEGLRLAEAAGKLTS